MLQSYSWSAFFACVGATYFLWYAGVALTVYRKECLSFFRLSRGMPSGVVPVTSYGQQDVPHFQEPQPVQPSVMGLSKTPQGLRSSSISEVSFAPETNGEVGLKSDIIAELKEIFTLLAENDGDKGDFLGLLEAMKLRYPPMASHPACAQINSFIKAHAPFLLSKQELENIWD